MGVYDDDNRNGTKKDVHDVEFYRRGSLKGAFNGVSALSAGAVVAGALGLAPLLTNGGISPDGILGTVGMFGLLGSPFVGAILAFPAAAALFNPERSGLSKVFSGGAAVAGGGAFMVLVGATGAGALGLFFFTPFMMMAAGVLNIAAELTKGQKPAAPQPPAPGQ